MKIQKKKYCSGISRNAAREIKCIYNMKESTVHAVTGAITMKNYSILYKLK